MQLTMLLVTNSRRPVRRTPRIIASTVQSCGRNSNQWEITFRTLTSTKQHFLAAPHDTHVTSALERAAGSVPAIEDETPYAEHSPRHASDGKKPALLSMKATKRLLQPSRKCVACLQWIWVNSSHLWHQRNTLDVLCNHSIEQSHGFTGGPLSHMFNIQSKVHILNLHQSQRSTTEDLPWQCFTECSSLCFKPQAAVESPSALTSQRTQWPSTARPSGPRPSTLSRCRR